MYHFKEFKVGFQVFILFIILFPLIFTNNEVRAQGKEYSGVCGENLNWELTEEDELIISGTGEMYDYEEDAPWDNYKYDIKKIIINEGVTSIGETAFIYCFDAKDISLPNSVLSIGYKAFWQCEGVESISISRNVKSIGTYAFGYCSSLKTIEVDGANQYYYSDGLALYNKDKTVLYQYALDSENTTYTVPETVTKLWCVSFASAKNLKSLYVMSNNVSAMGYTFSYDSFDVYCHKNTSLYRSIQSGDLAGNVVLYDIDTGSSANGNNKEPSKCNEGQCYIDNDNSTNNTDKQSKYNDNISYTFQDADGNSCSTAADGKAKVLIFGRENCGNTSWTLSKLKDNNYNHDSVDILLVDINRSDSETLRSYSEDYVVNGLTFVTADNAFRAMWDYIDLFPDVRNDDGVTIPVVVYINSDNKLVECISGAEDVDSRLEELFGLSENDEGENTKSDETDQENGSVKGSENDRDSEDEQLKKISFNVTYHQTEARSMLDSINEFRQDSENAWYWDEDNENKVYPSDLRVLEYDYELEKIAMQRAAEISLSYGHLRPNGSHYYNLLEGYSGSGENIAYGQTTSQKVFVAWREDDCNYSGQGHRRNMLGKNYNRVGIACAEYQGEKFWVQIFGNTTKALTGASSANDSETLVTIQALESNIVERGFYSGTSTFQIEVDECKNIKLPQPYVKLDASPFDRCPISISCEYTIADNDIATINSGQICGLKEGSTTLDSQAKIAGEDVNQKYTLEVYKHTNPVENESPTCYENLSRTYPTADGSSVSTAANGKPKLLIFYDEDCFWCGLLLEDIVEQSEKYQGIDIVAIDMYGSDLDNLRNYASSFGDSPITFCSGDYDLPFEYVRLWNNSSRISVGTPLTVFVNKDNLIVYNLSGYVDNMADYVSACFSDDWDNIAASCEHTRKEQEKRNTQYVENDNNKQENMSNTQSAQNYNNMNQNDVSPGLSANIPADSGNNKSSNEVFATQNNKTTAQPNVVNKQNANSKNAKESDLENESDNDVITIKNACYEIMSDNSVMLVNISGNTVKTYTVPDEVVYKNKKYKVTCIFDEAFMNCKSIKKLTIGKNIDEIGDSAFKNCKNLKTIIINSTKLTKNSFGKNVFKGINKKAIFKCQKKQFKNYKKWIKKVGAPKTAKYKKAN